MVCPASKGAVLGLERKDREFSPAEIRAGLGAAEHIWGLLAANYEGASSVMLGGFHKNKQRPKDVKDALQWQVAAADQEVALHQREMAAEALLLA